MFPNNQWIKNLDARERTIIFSIFSLFCIAVLKLLVWDPIIIGVKTARNDLESQQKSLYKVQAQADKITALRGLQGQHSLNNDNDQSIGRTINNSANKYNLVISRFQAGSDKTIELWMNDTFFDNFILWLETLKNNHEISVKSLRITAAEKSGTVNIKVIFD